MKIQHNIELQNYNSFRTKAKAKLFCTPESIEELQYVLKTYPKEKKLIIGDGNNLFFTNNFDGLIIKPLLKGIEVLQQSDNEVTIKVFAGENWDDFVNYCVKNKYAGIENLSLIPSSVGAVPVQNIGAYGAEAKDVISSVKAIHIESTKLVQFSNKLCKFGYRDSIFKQTSAYIIVSVEFKLSKIFNYINKYVDLNEELKEISSPTIEQVRDAIIKIRSNKLPDPKLLPNAGSFFKNPVLENKLKDKLLELLPEAPIYQLENNKFKTSAAYLIEKANYKGKRTGNIGIYENHALIMVNYGTDKGTDILKFMNEVKEAVIKKFGIILEPEVQIFGYTII